MDGTLRAAGVFFAAAMIALGVTGVVNGDFALVWQNVPAEVPGRTALAWLCAIVELATGIGLLLRPTLAAASRILFPYMLLWLVLLKVPGLVHAPRDVGSWGGFGEIGAMTAGAWCLFASLAGKREPRHPEWAVGANGIRAARGLLVIVLPLLGIEVIVDAVRAGDRVMQPWLQHLPHPMAWACLTGLGSIATCLALLSGVWPRFAATIEAAMVVVIGLAYWGPDLGTGRTATTAFIITLLVAAGIWVVADTYRHQPWFVTGRPVWKAEAG
ncbi:MAG: hypothetical protein U1F23_09460 [Lysobacterales bacterium]